MSLVHQTVDAVVDGVFDDGLEGDLVAEILRTVFLHVEVVGKLLLVAHALDLQIALGVLHLAADGDQFVALTDADAEQPRQRVDHHHGFRVLPLLAHPRNGIQRIVEEVGVDLRL